MITIQYVDDFGKKHLAFVKTSKDVRFYKDRFGKVDIDYSSYAPIKVKN